jgi:hypothetical protein
MFAGGHLCAPAAPKKALDYSIAMCTVFTSEGISAVSRRHKRVILMPERVIATIEKLRHRINERFGERGLYRVSGQLLTIAKADVRIVANIGRRYVWLRLVSLLALIAAGAVVWDLLPQFDFTTSAKTLEGIDATTHLVALTAGVILAVVTLEQRLKRRRALAALHELRSIVHVIDMHQLTKDPSKFVVGSTTPSSPPVELNEFEMTRYLEYCSEMLSLTSKVAVLFGQALDDPSVAEVVSDIEYVSDALAQKMWQKIMILQHLREKEAG